MDDNRPTLLELMSGYGKARVVEVAVQLGPAPYLAESAKTAGQVAALTETDSSAMYRLLCALAAIDMVSRDGDTFTLTALGRDCLVDDCERSLAPVVRYLADPVCWRTWESL